jgi:glycogen debranching enzyme
MAGHTSARDAGRLTAALAPLLSQDGWPYASLPPQVPGDPGAYHALFGRDALITSLQVLPARPDVARATLHALADRQATRTDPEIEAEPGKIGHEFRAEAPPPFAAAGYHPLREGSFSYYGTADATSWWLVLLAALDDRDLTQSLEPAWRAAAGWLQGALERGAGFIRHGLDAPRGSLVQQGWRDALDPEDSFGPGIVREDGSAPAPPIADADSQAVAFVALRAVARLTGDRVWEERAAALGERIGRCFVPATMALERGDRPVPGAGSQLGWILWSGALEPDLRAVAADRLSEPDVLTPWGLRTLAAGHPAFAAHSYHQGSVWPFDSWIGWGGLRAAGRTRAAEVVRAGVLAAVERLGLAPELYAVTRAGEVAMIPKATRVQAWTVGAQWALSAGWDGRTACNEVAPKGG